MNHRSKLRVPLLLATLAAAAPALAQADEMPTAPIVSGYYYVPPDGRFYAVPARVEYSVTPVFEERTTIYAERASAPRNAPWGPDDRLIVNDDDVVDAAGE